MADVFPPEKRSEIMRKVKSKRNESTEMRLITFFKANKIKGWRRNYPLPGKPDFVFPKLKIAIFADGCFWHGHDCRNTRPEQNKDYWAKKRERNVRRDLEVTETLSCKGWNVVRIWECEIKKVRFEEKLNTLY
ncbi:MAG: very short patch repair endonuclease [Bacteroidota bacterium]|uniref:very short patch repair endonuclease n=1 Tax=Runella sp. TaxID=1960881 RepID=UPI00301699FB